MIPVRDFAPSVANPHASSSARLGFTAACRKLAGSIARSASRMAWHTSPQPSAQDQSLAQLRALYRQRHHLLVEKEIVAAERKEAVRKHKATSAYDARLRAINRELLSIG